MTDKSKDQRNSSASSSKMGILKELGDACSQKAPKLKVPKSPEKILRRIFGTSHVFYVMTETTKRRMMGSTVPAKVREYYNQGHQCLLQEDWEMAVLFFSRALHLDPKLTSTYIVLRPSSSSATSPLPSRTSAGPTSMSQKMTNTWIGWPSCSTYRCLGCPTHRGILTLSPATGLPSAYRDPSWDRI